MPILAVACISEAPDYESGKVDQIVLDAAAFNVQAGATGALLFDGTRFLKCIEDPEDVLV